jgi:RHS repeat-associated protein
VQRATDSTKTINWTGNYEPFGAVTPTTTITMNQRFLNNYADNTGYYHNGFRDRNPSSTIGGGRMLQVDPLGLWPGLNPYVYLDNNPFKWIDPDGFDPGDHYPTQDKAGSEGVRSTYDQSMSEGKEYAGRTYQEPDGSYSYTAPNAGSPIKSTPGDCPPGMKCEGIYHTHPSVPGYDSEHFSPADKTHADVLNEPNYVGTANGRLKKFTPDPKAYGPGVGKSTDMGPVHQDQKHDVGPGTGGLY